MSIGCTAKSAQKMTHLIHFGALEVMSLVAPRYTRRRGHREAAGRRASGGEKARDGLSCWTEIAVHGFHNGPRDTTNHSNDHLESLHSETSLSVHIKSNL